MWCSRVKLYEEDYSCEIADLISKKSKKIPANFLPILPFSMTELLEMKKLQPGTTCPVMVAKIPPQIQKELDVWVNESNKGNFLAGFFSNLFEIREAISHE